jgi:hypothetical protein
MKIKVRLNTARVPAKGKPQATGELVSVDWREAVRLVESGQAEPTDKAKYAAALDDYRKEEDERRRHEADAAAESEAIALRRQAEELLQKAKELHPGEKETDGGDES